MYYDKKLELYKINKRIVRNRRSTFKSKDTWGINIYDLDDRIDAVHDALLLIRENISKLCTVESVLSELEDVLKEWYDEQDSSYVLSYYTTIQGYICYMQGKKVWVGDIYNEKRERRG